ncbi:MAG: hypothetical protein Q4G34_08255 [Micrococcus sp.]|nr:hypothetical protein [Micrococcus sp.]
MAEQAQGKGQDEARARTDEFLEGLTPGLEDLVNSRSFGVMLAQAASNMVALQRIGNEVMDLVVRNTRLAGRADVVSLHRQLARTEDKLELVLETVERLESELARERGVEAAPSAQQDEDVDEDVDENGTTSTAPRRRSAGRSGTAKG